MIFGKRSKNAHFVIRRAKDGLPTSSWWLETDRDAFAARASEEAARMSSSQFGTSARIIHAKDTERVDTP